MRYLYVPNQLVPVLRHISGVILSKTHDPPIRLNGCRSRVTSVRQYWFRYLSAKRFDESVEYDSERELKNRGHGFVSHSGLWELETRVYFRKSPPPIHSPTTFKRLLLYYQGFVSSDSRHLKSGRNNKVTTEKKWARRLRTNGARVARSSSEYRSGGFNVHATNRIFTYGTVRCF